MFSGRLGGWRGPLVLLRRSANAGFAGLDPEDRKQPCFRWGWALGLAPLASSWLALDPLLQLAEVDGGLASLIADSLVDLDVFDDVTDTESFPLQKVS